MQTSHILHAPAITFVNVRNGRMNTRIFYKKLEKGEDFSNHSDDKKYQKQFQLKIQNSINI